MDRTTVLWTLVVFFGASVLLGVIRNATEDESLGLRLGLQGVALAVVIAAIVLVVRRLR